MRTRRLAGLGLGVLLSLGWVSSVSAANREHLQMMADIRMLQEHAQQLQQMLVVLNDTLKQLNARIDDQTETSRKAFADQRLQIGTVTGDLRILREKLDDTNVRLSTLSQEVDALRAAMPSAMPTGTGLPVGTPEDVAAAAATTPAGAAPAPGQPLAPQPAASGQPPSTTGMSPQRLFETAYADYAAGQWVLAIQGFEAFIKTFPRSEQADEAQLYVGEAYQLDGKFDQAVAAYDRVIADYPTGDQVSLAYYKRGLALMRLNQVDRARESWETVVKRFPESDAAVLARQGLERLARTRR